MNTQTSPAISSTKTIPSKATARAAERATVQALLHTAYGPADVLRLGTIARPRPGAREVLVEVRAAALDRGAWHIMTGRPYLMRLAGYGLRAPKRPVLGRDLSGVVVEVGAEVTRFAVGDEVFGVGEGAFAELACAAEDKLSKKPAGLSFDEAAALGISGLTALDALTEHGELAPGERVLIVGASGGVGTCAVQIARALGAEVTAVCSTEKVELVRSLGAEAVIDYRTEDFTAGPARFDLVLDIGGNTPLARLRRVMTETGRLVFVGGEQGGDFTAGFERQLWAALLGPFVKQRFAMMLAKEHFSGLDRLAALAAEGKLRPVIDRRAPLAEVPAAMRDLQAGRVCGKVVVTVR